jgi:hypothetical protein
MTSKSFEANVVTLVASLEENEPLHWRVQEINREYKKRKDARDGVQKSWSSDRGETLMRYLFDSKQIQHSLHLQSLVKLAKYLTVEDTVSLHNTQIFQRLKGLSLALPAKCKDRGLIATDLRNAAKLVPLESPLQGSNMTQLKALGLKVGTIGLFETNRSMDWIDLTKLPREENNVEVAKNLTTTLDSEPQPRAAQQKRSRDVLDRGATPRKKQSLTPSPNPQALDTGLLRTLAFDKIATENSGSYFTNLIVPSSQVTPFNNTPRNLHPANAEGKGGCGDDPMQGVEGNELSSAIYDLRTKHLSDPATPLYEKEIGD